MDEADRRITLYWLFKNARLYPGSMDVILGEFIYGLSEEELVTLIGSEEWVRFYRDRGFYSLRYAARTKPRQHEATV